MARIPALAAPLRRPLSRSIIQSRCGSPWITQGQQQVQQRLYSDSTTTTTTAGPSASFYKTFGRPIFKVALLAIFTYQLAYYGWVKLETDEVKGEAAATIADLEQRIETLERARATKATK
ncbi:uncharacterized protein JN550_008652 [Neoarthrinium moseri]|uniref:uncharacterized protein n=1 Tax=Neoarthrinium moseri TaxID=1658444 RepID=UPI001FDAE9A1|nr:uncharacterized protein JN550_008652 [Neoarthrinium moseri]KAI1864832.1 hypothetical protein JN550_008652 [Neoarthrinium moseri]